VTETRRVAPGRAVVEIEVDLLDGEPGPQRVDGHAHLTPESRRKREAGCSRLLAQPALARERLAGREARPQTDELAPDALGEPEPTADAARERRHAQIRFSLRERRQRPAQVGVAEEERARRSHALAGGERLALPALRETEDDRAGRLGLGC